MKRSEFWMLMGAAITAPHTGRKTALAFAVVYMALAAMALYGEERGGDAPRT